MINRVDITIVHFSAHLSKFFGPLVFIYLALLIRPYGPSSNLLLESILLTSFVLLYISFLLVPDHYFLDNQKSKIWVYQQLTPCRYFIARFSKHTLSMFTTISMRSTDQYNGVPYVPEYLNESCG